MGAGVHRGSRLRFGEGALGGGLGGGAAHRVIKAAKASRSASDSAVATIERRTPCFHARWYAGGMAANAPRVLRRVTGSSPAA